MKDYTWNEWELKGAGVGTVIISFLLSTYYNVILAWTLFYLGVSVQGRLTNNIKSRLIKSREMRNQWNSHLTLY